MSEGQGRRGRGRRIAVLVLLVAVAAALVGAWWYLSKAPLPTTGLGGQLDRLAKAIGLRPKELPAGLTASGFIEAEEASVSTEFGGRIVSISADEGDEVAEGQALVDLDDSLLHSQVQAAQADLAMAQATLAQVKAGARRESVNYAQAVVDQAKAAEAAALVSLQDAEEMLNNPQDLELAIVATRAQLGTMDFQVEQAQALANAAQAARQLAEDTLVVLEGFEPYTDWFEVGQFDLNALPPDIPQPPQLEDGQYIIAGYKLVIQGNVITVYVQHRVAVPETTIDDARLKQATTTYESWQAWTALDQARAVLSGQAGQLEQLIQQKADPLTLQANVNAAKSQVQISTAAVDLAQAQLDGILIGATAEQVAAAEAQVAVARAALQALEVQSEKLALKAPIAGLVLERPVQVGEIAVPGAPLLTLARLDKLTLTIYVPEDQLGQVRVGQSVSVTVDAYPGQAFAGSVRSIGSEAEFTPKNVQTREERVNMVFAVKVELPNPTHALKPGMPADAVLGQ